MPNHLFPNGPTAKELFALKEGLKFRNEYGIFISATEFQTFSELFNTDRHEEREAIAEAIRALRMKRLMAKNEVQTESTAEVPAAGTEEIVVVDTDEETKETSSVAAEENGSSDESESDETEEFERGTIALFSMKLLKSLQKTVDEKYRDSSSKSQLTSSFGRWVSGGNKRQLSELPCDWTAKLNDLEQRYPNFAAVLDMIRLECQVANLSLTRVVQLPPILLAGDPGIGKTAFARDLATMLGTGIFAHSLETAQSSASLCGSSRFWSNTRTGLVFDALIDHQIANPIFLIDELDKVAADSRFDPIAPFYQLLEQHQARQFCDESIPDLPIDASHITWIFTANDIAKVPAPIFNRLVVFHVPKPTLLQGRGIINTLFEETVVKLSQSIDDEQTAGLLKRLQISPECVNALAEESIRQAKIKIRIAIVSALSKKYHVVHIPRGDDLRLMSAVAGKDGAH